jgi:transcriptional regulator with XRE-family HTH domain
MFPSDRHLLAELGHRLRLARKRRRFPVATVAQRAGISRTTLYHVENGDPSVTLGSYLRVLAVLGLEKDLAQVAADDPLGRRLQDLALDREPRR